MIRHEFMNHKILVAEQTWDSHCFAFKITQAPDLAVFADNNFRAITMTEITDLDRYTLLTKFHCQRYDHECCLNLFGF